MSRKWNKNTVITREILEKEFNIVHVDAFGWITTDGNVHEPTPSPQYRKDKQIVSYVVCQVCLYGGSPEKGKPKYLRAPFSKIVYAWYNGTTHSDKVIDHINQNPLDCRPENLREVEEFWNVSKNVRLWNWPQTKYWSAKERKKAGITFEQMVNALNDWIAESQKFLELAKENNNLFSSNRAN